MAYSTYSLPRRQSLGYRPTTPVSFPSYHDQLGSAYSEPMLHGEHYSQSPYPAYRSASSRNSHLFQSSYDDMGLRDSHYMDDRHTTPGVYPPVVQPLALGTPRRSSSVSYSARPHTFGNSFRRHTTSVIKFKRKGAFRSGVTLGEVQANVRLSGWDSYSFNDLGVDHRGKIHMRVVWPGYPSLNYEIPVDGYGDRVDLQSLARRVGRAVTHYLQANALPIPWDRIELQHMEEMNLGAWNLKVATH